MLKQNWEELKEKKVIAQWKDLQSYIDKIRLETEQEVKGRILEALPKITTHICRFNDSDCVCRCFESAINETKKIIKNI